MKRLLLTFLAFLAVIAVNAEQVSKQEALQRAQQFMPDKQFKETTSFARSDKPVENEAFYIFNAEDKKGFVIVSGDDRTEPILGYSDTGCLDLDNLPPNLKGWLEGYSKQIKALETSGYTGSKANARAATRTDKAPVEPLITTKWGQEGPYNLMCPEIDGQHCVTGCVATAMAQVMYYHKWPQDGCAAIPAYTTDTRQIQMDALPPTTFKWDKMCDHYWEGEQGESADAVAQLMRYCGQAVTMDYDIDESGSGVELQNLINYFDYSKNVKRMYMSQYTISQWEDILYKELSEGRPIIYEGKNLRSAHEFICDGYDGNGYYHFNWGWSGLVNGYFLLSLMYKEAIGYGFVEDQSAIIGLEPEKGTTVIPYVYGYNNAELTKTNYSRASTVEDFTNITLNGGIYIQYEVDIDQDVTLGYGLGLFQGNQLLSVLKQSTATLNLDNKAVANEMSLSFGSNLSDGSYQIRHIYKYPNSDAWETCFDAYLNYIVATISGTTMTLRNAISPDVQDADYIVNDVSFSGRRITIVTVNITNTGDTNQELLYFCNKSDGTIWNCAMVCGTIAPGETGDVVFPYVFPYTGDITMLISTKPGGQNVKWEKVVNIPEPLGQHLTCSSYSIKNFENEILNDSKLHFTFTITNDGEEIYDDGIGYTLQEHINNSNSNTLISNQTTQMLTLNKGESKTIELIIPNLKNNTTYAFDLYATNNLFSSPITFYVANQIYSYDDLNYSYDPITKTAYVIAGDYQQLETVTIPSTISVDGQSYKVTEIAPKALNNCHYKSVILLEGLESIGSYAFYGSEVKSITLPSTLKHINDQAFYYSSGIKEISLPEGLGSIGYAAFRDCRDLEVLRLPSTLKSLDYDVIFNCNNLKFVYSAMADPIKVAENAFVPCPATLIVPKGSVEKYQAAKGWNVFTRITDKGMYKLTYQVDGDEYKTIYVLEGDPITPEEAPTMEGYTFSGWSEIPETMPAEDVTVAGTFTVNKYNLVYMVDGGEYKSYEIEYGTTITPEEAPTKEGYTFSGWSEIPETMPAKDVIVTGVFSKKMEEKETIIISGSGKITLTSSEALDFSGFEDLKAYVATGYEGSGTIWLTRIKQVPAGTPILIKGTPEKSYEVPVMDKCVAHFENMFQGSAVEDMGIDVTSADGKWNNYYMASGSFKKVTGPRTIGKGKCYLQLPASFKAAKAGADQTVKIADSGKSSYAPPVDIDLTNVEGLKAYAATGYDAANRTIWLTRIFKIQAGEGVLLKGEKGKTYTLPSADVQAYYGNMFVGNIGDKITIDETSDDGEWTNFYLASGSFKKVSGTREIGTNKSYLQLPTSMLVSSARGKKNAGIDEWFMEELETETMLLGSIGGDDEDGSTRIDAIRQNNTQPDVYYNLQGQRVDNPKKGIYIHNGRKVVIK